jgi:hypothetical protein
MGNILHFAHSEPTFKIKCCLGFEVYGHIGNPRRVVVCAGDLFQGREPISRNSLINTAHGNNNLQLYRVFTSQTVVGITWTLILDPGCWTPDFASLDCTACIQPRLQAMAWW